MTRLFLLLILTIPTLQSCVTRNITMMRDDSLIGKIIDTGTNQPITFETLMTDISTHDVIYLSEKHDNADQHQFQEKVILHLIDQGLSPTIGFEFFSMENTPDLLNFIDSGKVAHSKKNEKIIENDLRVKLGWNTQSDKMWAFYYNILRLAKNNTLSVSGLDLSSSQKRRITRKGINGISPLEKDRIYSTQLSNSAYKSYMFDIFKAVHCGMGHEKMQSRLYDTWVARNDTMAHSITSLVKHAKGPAVIIIGFGHTEYGLGVINKVKTINPNIRQVNIGLSEINITPADIEEYTQKLNLEEFDAIPPADYLRFSQRVSYEDPCKEFKKSLEKMKKSNKK
jgi:uncharacterized iron-regulated protein